MKKEERKRMGRVRKMKWKKEERGHELRGEENAGEIRKRGG